MTTIGARTLTSDLSGADFGRPGGDLAAHRQRPAPDHEHERDHDERHGS